MTLHPPGLPNGTDPAIISDILNKAADLIEPKGAWVQRQSVSRNPDTSQLQFCAIGAINEAATRFNVNTRLGDGLSIRQKAITTAERLIIGPLARFLWEWNDRPERNQQEVVDTLRLAAKRWEEKYPTTSTLTS